MRYDECWYCMPCEADCPTGAVTVNIPIYCVRALGDASFRTLEQFDDIEDVVEQLNDPDPNPTSRSNKPCGLCGSERLVI